MKICQYFCLHMKIICWRFHIKTPFTFEICAREMYLLRKSPHLVWMRENTDQELRIRTLFTQCHVRLIYVLLSGETLRFSGEWKNMGFLSNIFDQVDIDIFCSWLGTGFRTLISINLSCFFKNLAEEVANSLMFFLTFFFSKIYHEW